MSNLHDFYKELERLRKPKSDDPYDNIVTHCYLLFEKIPEELHFFEVRGWKEIKDDKLDVSAVCWTAAAGTCSVYLSEDNLKYFKILTCLEYLDLIKQCELTDGENYRRYWKKKA